MHKLVSEDQIRTAFEKFGEVKLIEMRYSYAFVSYGNPQSVMRAVKALHRTDIFGGFSRNNVEVSISQREKFLMREPNYKDPYKN